ncbi:MAG: ATP-binding protein [Balneolales bacterium]|nr:ATP-binding protein [Balneolales bacterium]
MIRASISILLANTPNQVREAVTRLHVRGFDIETATIETNTELLSLYRQSNWDVLVADANQDAFDLTKALRSLRRKKVSTRVIATGTSKSKQEVNELITAGIHEFVPTSDPERFLLVLQKEIETAILQKRKKELEFDLNYKTQFIAKISHEMRTTLNSVILLSEILAENRNQNLNTEEIEYIDLIHGSSNNLLDLLNKILDLSKIQSGKMDIRLEDVNIHDFCNRLNRLYTQVAKEKGLVFEYISNELDELTIKTDRIRIEQILNNLISNAIKFTSKGFVQLKLYLPDTDEIDLQRIESDQVFALQVSDSGIGIDKEKIHLIFDSYVQAEGASTQKKYGGTGLGLAISKELAQIMGGKLDLKSTLGKGSTFTLYLPFDSTEVVMNKPEVEVVKFVERPELEPKQEVRKKKTRTSKGTILLVDNSTIHNTALKEFLSSVVKKCITAESAQEASNIIETKKPFDCIILDMYLPDGYGKDLLKQIKSIPEYEATPVIVYSGKTISKIEQAELLNDAIAIVQKNVNSYKVLMGHISDIMDRK